MNVNDTVGSRHLLNYLKLLRVYAVMCGPKGQNVSEEEHVRVIEMLNHEWYMMPEQLHGLCDELAATLLPITDEEYMEFMSNKQEVPNTIAIPMLQDDVRELILEYAAGCARLNEISWLDADCSEICETDQLLDKMGSMWFEIPQEIREYATHIHLALNITVLDALINMTKRTTQ